jgi:hypothetical protein
MLPFPLPLTVLMALEEDRQRQLKQLACHSSLGRAAGPAPQRSRRPLGGGTWANLFGRRHQGPLPATSLAAQ